MVRDITPALIHAQALTGCWSHQHFLHTIDSILRHNLELRVDWDVSSGEDWARIFDDETVIVYLSRTLPAAFILATHHYVVNSLNNLTIIELNNWSERLNIDITQAKSLFPDRDWGSYFVIDLGSFTVDELWYATV